MNILSRKNKMLLAGFVLGLILCYRFAIAGTITYYREYKDQKQLMEQQAHIPQLMRELMLRDRELNSALGNYNVAGDASFQSDLLERINSWCNRYKLAITGVDQPHHFTTAEHQVLTYTFTLQGSFAGSLQLISHLENNPALGYVKHVDFEKKRNYKSGTDYLITSIMLEKQTGKGNRDNQNKTP